MRGIEIMGWALAAVAYLAAGFLFSDGAMLRARNSARKLLIPSTVGLWLSVFLWPWFGLEHRVTFEGRSVMVCRLRTVSARPAFLLRGLLLLAVVAFAAGLARRWLGV